MNVLRILLVSALGGALVLSTACSSSSSKASKKTAASGAAKAKTSKQPASAPTPTKKAGSNVTSNQSSATPVEADPECTAQEEGLGACADSFVVFCSGSKVYALDCAEAFPGSTCGELDDGTIDCVVTTEE
jgi:hypothetical protein